MKTMQLRAFIDFLRERTELFFPVNSQTYSFPEEEQLEDFFTQVAAIKEGKRRRNPKKRDRKLEVAEKIFNSGRLLDLRGFDGKTMESLKSALTLTAHQALLSFNSQSPEFQLTAADVYALHEGEEKALVEKEIGRFAVNNRQKYEFARRFSTFARYLGFPMPQHIPEDDPDTNKSEFPINEIFYGPPGTGKTYEAYKIANKNVWQPTVITFHPSYTYEHFIQGERVVNIGKERTTQIIDGQLMVVYRRATDTYVSTKCWLSFDADKAYLTFPTGVLSRYEISTAAELVVSKIDNARDGEIKIISLSGGTAEVEWTGPKREGMIDLFFKARSWSSKKPQLLILDEINRADVQRVFGELMNVLANTDGAPSRGIPLQYSGEFFTWPHNMRIVATMNSADRSIGEIDQAMKRRFRIRKINSDPKLLAQPLDDDFFEIDDDQSLFDLLEHSHSQKDLVNAFRASYTNAKDSCDSFVNFYNTLLDYHGIHAQHRLPLPSSSLTNLHKILMSKERSLFALSRRMIGHSFHFEFVRKVVVQSAKSFSGGSMLDSEHVQEFAELISELYDSFLEHNLEPQVQSICQENDELSDEIIRLWRQEDSLSFKPAAKIKTLKA